MAPLLFPNYLQVPERLPLQAWLVLRLVVLAGTLGLGALLALRPASGLPIFWRAIVPFLPLVFFAVPGLWRNLCPLAASNQLPRLLGISRELTMPAWLRDRAYLVGLVLFLTLATTRKALFNANGAASSVLLFGALAAAFLGGWLYKGKSGWCSSFCPLLPVQRLYGQTPFLNVPNAHCRPCVGCTKNCYDFNPAVAQLADLHDDDPYYTGYRKLFAGVFPGFILAFFVLPDPPAISVIEMVLGFGAYISASAGAFYILDAVIRMSDVKLTALFAATALNLYFWFTLPALSGASGPLVWSARIALLATSAAWLARTFRRERLFVSHTLGPRTTRVEAGHLAVLQEAAGGTRHEVILQPEERRVLAEPDRTLLEILENSGLRIEAGCRMGVCGADPIAVLDGHANLSPASDDERCTLERLCLGPNARMACQARVRGAVCVSLDLSQARAKAAVHPREFELDPAVRTVVIIGNSIAGVTAADYLRRQHSECAIHLVGRESHTLYNRMALSRLIYGRSAMQGLYLLPDSWYTERDITCWVNTLARRIDRTAKRVVLGMGEELAYDRLILATGSRGVVPQVDGFGKVGTFVLHEAEDAIHIRAHAQAHECGRAAIAGGGLLGLEAGYALQKAGLDVSILERGERLLRRQLDERSSELLRGFLEGLGMTVVLRAESAAVRGAGSVREVVLRDGRTVPCDLFLACAGVEPNVELARDGNLLVNRGVVVDDRMRTSDPNIFAAGDAAEFGGEIPGLWPVAVEQGKVAAVNAIGGDRTYEPAVPFTVLKVVGIDLASIGRIESESPDDMTIALEEVEENRYRKLVVSDGKLVGAILLGYPNETQLVANAIRNNLDVSDRLAALRAGDWYVLNDADDAAPAVAA